MDVNKKSKKMTKVEAAKALEEEIGSEEFKKLMEGADAIIDITKKFGMPYAQVVEKIKESSENGLVVRSGNMIVGLEKKEKD
jgi:hypothetical protein